MSEVVGLGEVVDSERPQLMQRSDLRLDHVGAPAVERDIGDLGVLVDSVGDDRKLAVVVAGDGVALADVLVGGDMPPSLAMVRGGPVREALGRARRPFAASIPEACWRSREGERELLSEFEKGNLKGLEEIAATPQGHLTSFDKRRPDLEHDPLPAHDPGTRRFLRDPGVDCATGAESVFARERPVVSHQAGEIEG